MYEMIRGLTSGVKGSNNWIISGEHTESGGVLLASDPHLDNGIPTSWHLSEINFYDHNKNELFIVGVTMPGMPVFTIGRNNKLAFAVTVLFNDNSDLFLETLDSTATKYLFDG
jgi:penicillin amidase